MSNPSPPPDPIYILRGLGASITTLEFSSKSTEKQKKLLSGDTAGLVRVWNLTKKRTETTLDGHNSKSILNVRYLNDNQILSQGRDGQVKIWSLLEGKGETTATIDVSDLGFCKCEILVGTNLVIAAVSNEDQSQIDIINGTSKEIVMKLKPESTKSLGMCMCLKRAMMTDNQVIIAGYENGDIILWDIKQSKFLDQLNLHKEPVMCIDFDSTTQRGVTGSADNTLTVFQLTHQGKLVTEKTVHIKNPGISAVKIRDDSKILAAGGWDNKIRIFSWKSLKPLAVLNYHSKSVDALAFSQCDEKILAAGSKDGRISLWSLYRDS